LSLIEESLDKFGDEFLVSTREFHGLLEDYLELARRTGTAGSGAVIGEQIFHGDTERFCELGQDV